MTARRGVNDMADLNDYFRVGVITSLHGVHGEVNVFPTTDVVSRFDDLKTVLMTKPGGAGEGRLLHVRSVKYFKNMVILGFDEIKTMNETELLRKYELYVSREDAVALEEGEYFIADLIGMKVVSDEGLDLGELYDVLQTGANDVYVTRSEGYGEVLIPAIPQCIQDIDMDQRVIRVHLLPGLLEG